MKHKNKKDDITGCCRKCPVCHKKIKIDLLKQHLKEVHGIDS